MATDSRDLSFSERFQEIPRNRGQTAASGTLQDRPRDRSSVGVSQFLASEMIAYHSSGFFSVKFSYGGNQKTGLSNPHRWSTEKRWCFVFSRCCAIHGAPLPSLIPGETSFLPHRRQISHSANGIREHWSYGIHASDLKVISLGLYMERRRSRPSESFSFH